MLSGRPNSCDAAGGRYIARGAAPMPVRIFLSTVSDEFRDYRDQLRHDLTRHNVEVKVQEDFKDLGTVTLDKLDVYITNCDAVVHLVGDMTGAAAKPDSTKSMLAKYPDLPDRLPPLRQPLADGLAISYTQWEAWLALYHGKLLVIAKADDAAPRGSIRRSRWRAVLPPGAPIPDMTTPSCRKSRPSGSMPRRWRITPLHPIRRCTRDSANALRHRAAPHLLLLLRHKFLRCDRAGIAV
jgi:hypothetical protein